MQTAGEMWGHFVWEPEGICGGIDGNGRSQKEIVPPRYPRWPSPVYQSVSALSVRRTTMSNTNYTLQSALQRLSEARVYITIGDYKLACTSFQFAKMNFAELGDVKNARRSYIMEILAGRKAGWNATYDKCQINDDEMNYVDPDMLKLS